MTDQEIIEQAVEMLRKKMPPRWELQLDAPERGGEDALLTFKGPAASSTAMVLEARSSFTPREVLGLLGGLGRRVRQRSGNTPILVVAPFLSPRTRDLLAGQEIGYFDFTGNARVVLDYPGLFIDTRGAERDPATRKRPNRGLAGAKVGKMIRVLTDAKPPYGVGDVAKASNVTPGYVSRILEVLNREALVKRDTRGPIEEVMWADLLRRRAESVDLFPRGTTFGFIAPNGARAALESLGEIRIGPPWAVTGSFAAVRLAQVAAPAVLVIYCNKPPALAGALRLLPADQGADVILRQPTNDGVFAGVIAEDDGINRVAPSQIVIDCLSGTGRMPAEGEAVLKWMVSNEERWRAENIDDLIERWRSSRWE